MADHTFSVHNHGMAELTAKHQRFVEEYLVDLNAKQAAIRAGYSPRSAEVTGHRILRDANVDAHVQARLQKRSGKTQITAERVLTEIARLAFVDPRQAFDDNGRLLDIKQIPDDVAASLASIEVDENRDMQGNFTGYTKKVKFWNKVSALEQLCKHLGLTREKIELTGKDGGPIEIADITEEERARRVLVLIRKYEMITNDDRTADSGNAITHDASGS